MSEPIDGAEVNTSLNHANRISTISHEVTNLRSTAAALFLVASEEGPGIAPHRKAAQRLRNGA